MAEIGTPENPEIIEPGDHPRSQTMQEPSGFSRWRLALQVLRVLVSVTLPGLGFAMIFAWIFHTAVNYGGVLPWLALIVISLPTLLLTLVAIIANLILWPAMILILSGRATQNPLQNMRFRFVTIGRR